MPLGGGFFGALEPVRLGERIFSLVERCSLLEGGLVHDLNLLCVDANLIRPLDLLAAVFLLKEGLVQALLLLEGRGCGERYLRLLGPQSLPLRETGSSDVGGGDLEEGLVKTLSGFQLR